ncbi:MAG TPA: UTP--glucose-1-phosphate uridylyltransferase GalU [Limnobacter sp.]|uniref:UTP--glucose-1-phosphate uridylyltransferase GalU n=1 Tax=Limnobacter sp. TaxID=2003368 RepID=UPI002ED905E0
MAKVRKAVFPVAGMGTRFLPATKASPKEMMPVVDKPLIQYAVEEALEAGITELVFITGRSKRSIEDHFDKAYELEAELEARGKKAMLELVKNIVPSHVNCIYIRQMEPLGLGHAVLCAQSVVGADPFAVLLADDLMDVNKGTPSVTHQMVKIFEREHASVLAVQEVPKEDTKSYGIVSSTPWNAKSERVNAIVEKPDPKDAPTNLAVVGRYVLTSQIFDHIRKTGKGAGGEIQLTDGIASLLNDQPVLAYRFDGTRFDCGSKIGYLKATVELGLKHPEVSKEFSAYLSKRG